MRPAHPFRGQVFVSLLNDTRIFQYRLSQFISVLRFVTGNKSVYQFVKQRKFPDCARIHVQVILQRRREYLPQADVMQTGAFTYFTYRNIANSACGVVHYAAKRLFISGIYNKPEIADDVFYLLSLIKRKPPINNIRNIFLAQRLFKDTRLGIGTIKDGNIRKSGMPFVAHPCDFIGYDKPLLKIGKGTHHFNFLTLFIFRENLFEDLLLIFFYKTVGSVYNVLRGPIILF
ncbi:hypothetical protein SDC9_96422 [bioreactor metagenome]|uniref:Uncharacterized protein n=1 Tax=bioreactor metagenome TaxID=1076179 RepID=A0A645A988_9ZZZZ